MLEIQSDTKGHTFLPKYEQIVQGVKDLIRNKNLVVGSPLPSIRQICDQNQLSQETVLKAYTQLKENGIIKSQPRKGYFVTSDQVDHIKNVFLLFDELSEYKKVLYNTIRDGLPSGMAKVEVFFHHCNIEVFRTLVLNNMNSYNVFIVMSFGHKKIPTILSNLSGKDVLLLDRKECVDDLQYNYIVQNFNQSVYTCLTSALQLIKKYKKFTLVFPDTDSITSNAAKAPKEIKKGFSRFCKEYMVVHEIVSEVGDIHKDEAFFVIDDLDMVGIIKQVGAKGYKLGQTLGLVSYNDSPVKEVLANGITVLTTDFEQMGKQVISYIIDGSKTVKETVTTELIIRKSL